MGLLDKLKGKAGEVAGDLVSAAVQKLKNVIDEVHSFAPHLKEVGYRLERPAGSTAGDQKRVVTPAEAIAAGASHIVVGRPITEAADPATQARAILAQISG